MKVQDLDQVEAWKGGAMLPVGRHTVLIAEATEGETSNGNPQIELEFSNDAGSIRDWLVVIPTTYGKAKSLLEAAGIAVESGEWEFPVAALKGKRLMIVVGEEPDYNDPEKTRRRVQAYEPLGDSSNGTPADDSDLPF